MSIRETLSGLTKNLSEENYDKSFAQYRFWLNVGIVHGYIKRDSDKVIDDAHLIIREGHVRPHQGELIHPDIPLFSRFVRDIEADEVMCEHVPKIERSCTASVGGFLEEGLRLVALHHSVQQAELRGPTSPLTWHPAIQPRSNYRSPEILEEEKSRIQFATRTNLIACWANIGYVERAVLRDHILQSLITHPKLYDHEADAIIILFKVAGATFGAYVDPSVIDRCFELLENHYDRDSVKGRLAREVFKLRARGWEGLPPPPGFAIRRPKPVGIGQEDSGATPVAAPLGLPNTDPGPQTPQPSTTPVLETEPAPASPIAQSPSISIASLSDFAIPDTSDDEAPIDPTTITPHDTFYLEDGNVEVLCWHTLFRVHTSILSLHSSALRKMFAQANLATAESPNGCPRILSSDTAADFATLLKMIYLLGFPERNKVPDFSTFSSLLRITTKYEIQSVRSQVLEIVRDAYPETFEELTSTKALGENVFTGPTPHPNEVLRLFIQQNLTSALRMAYYMAARRGLRSLMDRSLPRSATLSPEALQSAIGGFTALREVELNETYRLILGSKLSHPCSSKNCPSRRTVGPSASEAHQKVIDRITGPSGSGTKVLQVLSLSGVLEGDSAGFCEICVKGWEAGHVAVRRRAWDMLPSVFGLKD